MQLPSSQGRARALLFSSLMDQSELSLRISGYLEIRFEAKKGWDETPSRSSFCNESHPCRYHKRTPWTRRYDDSLELKGLTRLSYLLGWVPTMSFCFIIVSLKWSFSAWVWPIKPRPTPIFLVSTLLFDLVPFISYYYWKGHHRNK